jgi:hypothetical protein
MALHLAAVTLQGSLQYSRIRSIVSSSCHLDYWITEKIVKLPNGPDSNHNFVRGMGAKRLFCAKNKKG